MEPEKKVPRHAALDLPPAALEAGEIGKAVHPRGGRRDAQYGTAGFRMDAGELDHVMYRMGILAALRSRALRGQAVGVMITASHNPERDNGVKLVEPLGEMLTMDWEVHATALANASDDALAGVIADLAKKLGINLDDPAKVVVGRDTRASSVALFTAVCDGVGAMRPSGVRSLGLATTPQLHYVVRCENTASGYGAPTLVGYADKYATAYERLASGSAATSRYSGEVVVDCANGVGAVALRGMLQRLSAAGLRASVCNDGGGALNEGCGADFVKIKQAAPSGVSVSPGKRFVSLDGDADRIVYFFFADSGAFQLLDGDRIALLLAHFLAKLLREAGIEGLRLGLVQTAYANGASTRKAVEAVGADNVLCAKTGVKHCHHAALELDANGHGTALFSEAFSQRVAAAAQGGGETGAAAGRLLAMRDLINEAVGDAISIMLAVEVVLRSLDWSCSEWLAMYADLPNRQVKVKVADRSLFETTDAERVCVKPEGLQAEIDALVRLHPQGRAFVRPSGTEDVVRVYAEAASLEATLALAQAVVDVVYAKAGGMGDKPWKSTGSLNQEGHPAASPQLAVERWARQAGTIGDADQRKPDKSERSKGPRRQHHVLSLGVPGMPGDGSTPWAAASASPRAVGLQSLCDMSRSGPCALAAMLPAAVPRAAIGWWPLLRGTAPSGPAWGHPSRRGGPRRAPRRWALGALGPRGAGTGRAGALRLKYRRCLLRLRYDGNGFKCSYFNRNDPIQAKRPCQSVEGALEAALGAVSGGAQVTLLSITDKGVSADTTYALAASHEAACERDTGLEVCRNWSDQTVEKANLWMREACLPMSVTDISRWRIPSPGATPAAVGGQRFGRQRDGAVENVRVLHPAPGEVQQRVHGQHKGVLRVARERDRTLNVSAMRAAAQLFVGTHSFHAFTHGHGRDKDAARRLSRVSVEPRLRAPGRGAAPVEVLCITISGDSFLYRMCRLIAFALVMVGLGRRNAAWVSELLAQRRRWRQLRRNRLRPAPAHGLRLADCALRAPPDLGRLRALLQERERSRGAGAQPAPA
ncbi:unnamed protein product [Prorocentrum cordatum]|uniref:phosphoacetylglucosamine mutase n=1 Tax=Prorocentrum cordatum TaxID=2364126 RepID=A0ABN9UTC6_9DINO|nr:unnamed protein product [Polarella glacialis]